jgi:hypothetical protein
MSDKIYDKATDEALKRLRSCIQEVEGGAQEDRAALQEMHQLLTVISGLLDVATFCPIEERLRMIRSELQHGFVLLEDVGIDGDSGRDAA